MEFHCLHPPWIRDGWVTSLCSYTNELPAPESHLASLVHSIVFSLHWYDRVESLGTDWNSPSDLFSSSKVGMVYSVPLIRSHTEMVISSYCPETSWQNILRNCIKSPTQIIRYLISHITWAKSKFAIITRESPVKSVMPMGNEYTDKPFWK